MFSMNCEVNFLILLSLSLRFDVLGVVAKPCSHPFEMVFCPCRLYMPFACSIGCNRWQSIYVQIAKPFSYIL
jgi:hypothetical protein